jgi:hypothetical protein
MQSKQQYQILDLSGIFLALSGLEETVKKKCIFPFSVFRISQGSSQEPPKTSATLLSHPAELVCEEIVKCNV